jgi:protein-disulfide isomerase
MSSSKAGASPRVPRWAIAATIALAIVVVTVLIAISAGGGDDNGKGTAVDLSSIPQQGDRLGEANAPVEIVEYADLQCPFCADAARTTVPEVVDKYVRGGTARLVFRPLTFIGDDSVRGAQAAAAAAEQNKMWDYVEFLYGQQKGENDGWLSDALVTRAASEVGLDSAKFETDRTGDAARQLVARAAQQAQTDGVNGTPTFVVSGPKGKIVVQDYRNLGEFDAAVQSVR